MDFSTGKERVTEASESFLHEVLYQGSNKYDEKDFVWDELHSLKLSQHLLELDLKSETTYERPSFSVDRLRDYCESIDSYPQTCWGYGLGINSSDQCPSLGDKDSSGLLFPKPLPAEEQKCSHNELTYSQENGKISRLRLERRKLSLNEAKQRCESFEMDIYTPYTHSEAEKILKQFRDHNPWLSSTDELIFWTSMERINSGNDQNVIIAPVVMNEALLERYNKADSICMRFKDGKATIAEKETCDDTNDQTSHNFMCVGTIKDGYKQQRKIVLNYEFNNKEVFVDFVPSVHTIRFIQNPLLNQTLSSWSGRSKPNQNLAQDQILFSYYGIAPWNGQTLNQRGFTSKFLHFNLNT